jgi:hypothetical protein
LGDEFGNELIYPIVKLKRLLPGDTTILRLVRPALGLGGRYYLKVETNYDKAVPEQEWFNNSVIIPLYVGAPSLPVSLVDFAATKQGKQALLSWRTKTEAGVVRYTVEQSTSGGDWKTVGSIAPQQNAQDDNTYQLVHTNPARGTNYYRLKVTEANGNTVWSAIRKLHFDGSNVSVFPNPFADFLSISSSGNWQVELYDAAGKLLMRQNGSGLQRLQTRNLQAGSYLVRFTDNSGYTESFKLQKQ